MKSPGIKLNPPLSQNELYILNALIAGKSVSEISKNRKKEHLLPSSVSYIEKALNALRKRFAARTTLQLVFVLKHHLGINASKK